jgi:hypothetical protein
VARRHIWMAAVVFLATGPPVSAQWLDPDRCITCPDKLQHLVGGVGLDVLSRGPWVTKSFRDRAWKRIVITAVVATSWEMIEAAEAHREGKAGRPGYGFGPVDVVATVAGAALVEGVQAVAHRLRRRGTNQPRG